MKNRDIGLKCGETKLLNVFDNWLKDGVKIFSKYKHTKCVQDCPDILYVRKSGLVR